MLYKEIDEYQQHCNCFYENSSLEQYIHDTLEGKSIKFDKDHYSSIGGPQFHIQIIESDIFNYIPFTQEDIIIFIEKLKFKFPFWSFHANVAFVADQRLAFQYLKEFLNLYKDISLLHVINGLNSILIPKVRKRLIYSYGYNKDKNFFSSKDYDDDSEIEKYKFYVPYSKKVDVIDILNMLQIINVYYKNFEHDYSYRSCQILIKYFYRLENFLQDNQLLIPQIKYELLSLKKTIFIICSKTKINRNYSFYKFFVYNRPFVKRFLTDYYFIFHRKKRKPNINDWVNGSISNYSDEEKRKIDSLLNNICIPFNKFQLRINNILQILSVDGAYIEGIEFY